MSVFEALKTADCSVNKGCAANLPDTAETGTIGLGKKGQSYTTYTAKKKKWILWWFLDKKGKISTGSIIFHKTGQKRTKNNDTS
jgi:hypothetical protein